MRLSEENLPITVRKTRIAYAQNYLISILLILSIGLISFVPDLKILFYALAAAGAVMLIATEVVVLTSSLVIDSNKVTQTSGLLSKHSRSVYYEYMTHISVHQSLLERMLNYGILEINTAGGTHEYEIVFEKLRNPTGVRNFIEALEKKHAVTRAGMIRK